jgi:hypothetical protein
MKITFIISILFIFSLVSTQPSFSEENGWTAITIANDTIKSCSIGTISEGSVNLISSSAVIKIPIDSLKTLIRHGESHFWGGAGYGSLIGFAVGAIIGAGTYHKPTGPFAIDFGQTAETLGGGLLGGVAGFAIGGVIGAISGGGDAYDLAEKSMTEKIEILREIRRESHTDKVQ